MTGAFHRLPNGGRIDRLKPLDFHFDGKRLQGFEGDTIASALLASGVDLVGRSFKYHRPRGIYSAGVEEPCGLVTLDEGARRDPNVASTTYELRQNLRAISQNRWPSLKFDALSVNRLAGPMLAAGFYYKTFMGPSKKSWMRYEPLIRRAAGLGVATLEPDPDRYEGRHEFCDLVVVGAGPAGLAAALSAGRAGALVLLVEQEFLAGGALLNEPVGSPAAEWLSAMLVELESLPNVQLATRTTVFGLYDHNTLGLLERRDHEQPDPSSGRARQVVVTVRTKSIVFATGAIERPLVFNNNDRPGVMLAGAARAYLNRFAVAPRSSVVVATNNDGAYAAAFDLADAGMHVTVADLRATVDDAIKARAKVKGIDLLAGMAVVDVTGGRKVEAALIAPFRADGGKPAFSHESRKADGVLVSGGYSPAVHLTSHLGQKPVFHEGIAAFVPGGFAEGHSGAGALMGEFSTAGAIVAGFRAGAAVNSGKVGDPPAAPEMPNELGIAITPVWRIPGLKKGKAFVDIQNDVTVSDIEIANREGYQSVEHLKRYTTLGMATDQGKTSNVNALAIMAELTSRDIPGTGTTTFRPPYTGVAIGALAGRAVGAHFRPVRRSPLDDWHRANGAEFIEAGPWLRAWWYRGSGPTVETAYVEEMRAVRSGVGIADVSTLGKIDVHGPDAAEFLNRLYVNGFRKLAPGKARYGVMLADDGIVFDDGTTTRLSETRFFMTTTTAMAGEVMTWLEYLLETAWTDLRVHVASLTDEWAGMSVAGPRARATLETAFLGQDLGNDALPFMGAKEFETGGVPVRVIRLSFSGELAFEVFTPADYGIAIWEHILAAGALHGIKPYGLEALASLRIEKGHVAGIELDHRNTLQDLGLSKMAAAEKPFVGKPLMTRPGHLEPDRWSLVGFESLEEGKPVRGGSILFADGEPQQGHGRGYLTSICFSPELGKTIALGLLKGGMAHAGETVVAAFPLKGETVRVKVTSPMFLDPKGERLHG